MDTAFLTHNYTQRTPERNYWVNQILEHGQQLEIFGWGAGVQVGDMLILRGGRHGILHRVEEIDYRSPQQDLWWANVKRLPKEQQL